VLAVVTVLLGLIGCEGDGGSRGPVLRAQSIAPGCTPIPALSPFPSGLAVLSDAVRRAAVVQLQPNAVVVYDVDRERPATAALYTLPLDSDGDGIDDAVANEPYAGFPFVYPTPGEIQAPSDELGIVSTSGYEQVLFVDPATAVPIAVEVDVPAAIPPERFPLLPAPGTSAMRTGLSARACIEPTDPVDSGGTAVGIEPLCSAATPSFLTNLTAGKAIAAGHLFVATSNLRSGGRFFPSTVLVFDWMEAGGAIVVRPSVATPVLEPSGYNATGLETVTTPGGRELVLVTVSGAIGGASGASNVLTEGFVDVIDPTVPRIAATIPLGLAGPAFDAPAVDPQGRVAWLGATSQRQIYAVDLRALDDPALYGGAGPPIVLDGMTMGFPDARIFTADAPLVLPPRSDGRSSVACEGLTDVTTNASGTEVFATDFCDGTVTRVAVDLPPGTPIPAPAFQFQVFAQSNAFAPNDAVGELRAPIRIVARPGVPGVDYTTPDVLAIVGQPDGQLCALRIESP
jgi:hypothetical protein